MPVRTIPLKDIPAHLQPLAVEINKLERAIVTTKNALSMNFDHIIGLLVDLKKTSMNLITQAKMLEKVAQRKDNSTS